MSFGKYRGHRHMMDKCLDAPGSVHACGIFVLYTAGACTSQTKPNQANGGDEPSNQKKACLRGIRPLDSLRMWSIG